MTIEQLITQLQQGSVDFNQVMAVIDAHYDFTPTAFQNGKVLNAAGQNNGSCKLFAFAKLHNLDERTTLNGFGDFYLGVLDTPEGEDHSNIRSFIKTGWAGIQFEDEPLKETFARDESTAKNG